MNRWQLRASLVIVGLFMSAITARGQDADLNIVTQIVKEIESLPSLYAKNAKPVAIESLPRFSAKAVTQLGVDKVLPLEKARGNWKANPEKYSRAVPLRAAYFTAADNIEQARRLIVPAVFIPRDALGPKSKVFFLKKQEPLGMAIFQMEQALAQIKDAEEKRDKDKSMIWRARFDWARAITEADLVFLYEYNYTLGQVRADNLPELAKSDDGWKIVFQGKSNVPEGKVKDLSKRLKKHWEQIQEEYKDTPFAWFAEREAKRDVGMTWAARKK